ncbi:hypothetical protein N0V90_002094 [Kalmusia sp. IMI 367209]|nr:hypothetical protein N0V90_002094 [Kalmusia sp. IMI 367209]
MSNLFLFLAVCLYCIWLAGAVQLSDLMTIAGGNTFGGCAGRLGPPDILDAWHEESIDSLSVAIDALVNKWDQNNNDGRRVRAALNVFFRIPPNRGATSRSLKNTIQRNLGRVFDWLQDDLEGIPPASTFLFCDSTFLVQKNAATDQAQDYQGRGITVNNNPITIGGVTVYANNLRGGNIPWWSGNRSPINGYYFAGPNSGGNYCNDPGHYGLTSTLNALRGNPSGGQPVTHAQYQSVILCPSAFDNTVQVNSWNAGNAATQVGTSLQAVTPKSTTLMHEAFHVVFGTQMLQGDSEIYTLARCVAATANPSRRNPESYVYFVAAMYYLFGDPADGVIATNWNFAETPGNAQVP